MAAPKAFRTNQPTLSTVSPSKGSKAAADDEDEFGDTDVGMLLG